MKKILLISLTMLILASAAFASPLCASGVHLDQYMANYNGISNACLIGNVLFYDFNFSSSMPAAVTAAQTGVVPDQGDGVTDPGIDFSNGNFRVNNGGALTVIITYSVATNGGSAVMSGYGLTQAGSQTPPGGLGTGSVTETFSNNPTGTPLITSLGGSGTASTDFLPWVSGTTVNTQIQLQSQGTGDIISISAVQEHFYETVPEPYETVLIGSGLLFFGLYRRRNAIKR
jgi:hypothetical protein